MTFARSEEPFCRRLKSAQCTTTSSKTSMIGPAEIAKVRLTKGTSTFCYPENIRRELKRVFGCLKA